MSSPTDSPESSSSSPTADELEDHQIRRLTLLLHFIFRLAARHRHNQLHDEDSIIDLPLRVILFNPATRATVMIDRSIDLASLLEEVSTKPGLLPASKDSMAAMPTVVITEEEDYDQCAICLEDYVIGEEAREMPCKHRFHPRCIDKWLGIHGVCPVCRFSMPVDVELDGGETMEGS